MSILASLWQNYDKVVPILMSLIYRSTPIKMLISSMFNYLWLILICLSIPFFHAKKKKKRKWLEDCLLLLLFLTMQWKHILASSKDQIVLGCLGPHTYATRRSVLLCSAFIQVVCTGSQKSFSFLKTYIFLWNWILHHLS